MSDDLRRKAESYKYYHEAREDADRSIRATAWPNNLWDWIQLGGVFFAFLASILGAGVAFGPISGTPAAIKALDTRTQAIETKLISIEWHLDDQRKQSVALAERMSRSEADRSEIWKITRKLEGDEPNYLTKLDFVEWKGTFEARNPKTSVPPLNKKGLD